MKSNYQSDWHIINHQVIVLCIEIFANFTNIFILWFFVCLSVFFILVTVTEKLNLPFGRPKVMQKNKEHCLLYHREYVSGFGKAFKMPIWSSYTVQKPVSSCVH